MKTEEKIRDILNRHYGHEVIAGSDLWFTKQYQDRYAHLLEMAEWKEKQMIEKACRWLDCNITNDPTRGLNTKYGRSITHGELLQEFKKAIEE